MDIDFTLTGQRIREARQYRGWTADVLAEKVALATESLRHIENASSKPSLQTLFRIATELDVSLDYITGRTPDLTSAFTDSYSKNFGLSEQQERMIQDVIKSIVPVVAKYL
ncbi:helix-turn-helix transcriptional regulator [uncultured Negativibacillus sp.]|uniref:helix-turn-helix domain-containing protein n=1 Tax=uncultured Negativibacillus sp. TaxID=1980696 RepID=UPI0025DA1D69|nr:helix-turn-helix transcriptional regulator [uncultured Negativibacillus sp.]